MRYLSLTFKNIRKFVRYHPVMFALFIAVQVICCVAVFLTCGMAYNMFSANEKAAEYMHYTISFEQNAEDFDNLGDTYEDENGRFYWLPQVEYTAEDGQVYWLPDEKADPSQRIYAIERRGVVPIAAMREKLPVLLEKLDGYHIGAVHLLVFPNKTETPDSTASDYFLTLYPDDSMKMNTQQSIDNIYLFSTDKIIIDTERNQADRIGTTRRMNGYDYKYAAVKEGGIPFIPYQALDDAFVVYMMNVFFEDKLTQQDLDKITPIFQSLFNEYMREAIPPDPYDPLDLALNQMVYVISLVVMVIILLAIAKFYSYVLSDRKKTLAILRLCGCSRRRVHLIYMLEIFLMMAVTSLIGLGLFRYAFFTGIAEMYPSFKELYTNEMYWFVLAAYMAVAMVVMAVTVIPSTKAAITDMKRNA